MSTTLTEADEKLVQEQARIEKLKGPIHSVRDARENRSVASSTTKTAGDGEAPDTVAAAS